MTATQTPLRREPCSTRRGRILIGDGRRKLKRDARAGSEKPGKKARLIANIIRDHETQTRKALVARDLALKLGNYADDQMRIEYRALVNAGPPHEIVVWWTVFKVLNVIWHDDERAVVVSYRGGPWEGWLKRKAAS